MIPESALTLKTEDGDLRGLIAAPGIQSFLGIPYAAPPIGARRWQPPQPVQPWLGVRDATQFSLDCPQTLDVGSRAPGQGEDCLYLNIWAPEDRSERLPVLVWVYGGSFISGSGSEKRLDGARLASLGAVVVTINYRIGIFGYLAHRDLSQESDFGVSGNYGLLDQIEAFKWIRKNIGSFGGDPSNVTAFGVSAGSASIAALLSSPFGNVFDKAILESAGSGRPLASLADAESTGAELGAQIADLRALSFEQVLARTNVFVPKRRALTRPRVLRPICDGRYIVEDERASLKRGLRNPIPIIVGTNLDEGSEFVRGWPVKTLEEYKALLASDFGSLVERALLLYPPGVDGTDIETRLGDLFSDTQFNYGARLLCEAAVRSNVPAWRYLFTRRRPNAAGGPHHGQEVHYVFGNLGADYPGESKDFDNVDQALSMEMMQRWVAFAKTGDPNTSPYIKWSPFDAAQHNHLEFGATVRDGQGWRQRETDFLDQLFASRL